MNRLYFKCSEKKLEKGEVYLCRNFQIYPPKNELFDVESLYKNDNEICNDKNSVDKYGEESKEKIKDINKIEFTINDICNFETINIQKNEDIKLKKKRGRKRKSP